jgi:DNA-3-methyladenine glycosylase
VVSRLDKEFFIKPAIQVSKNVLGKYLVHKTSNGILSGKIVEVEAYIGPHDKASHARKGITERNKAEFMEGGHIYIYLVYGMYWQLNISTGKKDYPECFLIRALEPMDGIEIMKKNRETNNINNLTNGPGKLCEAMGFSKIHYAIDITKDKKIYIEDRSEIISNPSQRLVSPRLKIVKSKRIGIDYAQEWKDKLLRFYIKNNTFVSKID